MGMMQWHSDHKGGTKSKCLKIAWNPCGLENQVIGLFMIGLSFKGISFHERTVRETLVRFHWFKSIYHFQLFQNLPLYMSL